MIDSYRPTIEVTLTPRGGQIERSYRIIDLEHASSGKSLPIPLSATSVPEFALSGIHKTLRELVGDLNRKTLEDLRTVYNDINQRRIGERLSATVLDGLDLEALDPGEIRIRVTEQKGAGDADIELADCLRVAPWCLMTEPRADRPHGFLCSPNDSDRGSIAVSMRGGGTPFDVQIFRSVHIRFFIPGMVLGPYATEHLDDCLRELRSVAELGVGGELPGGPTVTYEATAGIADLTAPGRGGVSPTVLYIVTHGYEEAGDTWLVTGPGDSERISLSSLRRKIEPLQISLLVILACNGDGDARIGAGACLGDAVPALLASRMELSFDVASSFGPAFLGLIVGERYTPAQAFATVLATNDPDNGAVAASWSALSLHANYESWHSVGTGGNALLDPLWRRDLPLLLDRRQATETAAEFRLRSIAWAEHGTGLKLYRAACSGGAGSGGSAYLTRLMTEIAESHPRLTVFDTLVDWGRTRMPDPAKGEGALLDHLAAALEFGVAGLRPLSRPRRKGLEVERHASAFGNRLKVRAALEKLLSQTGGQIPCFVIRHTPLSQRDGPLPPAEVMGYYLALWDMVARAIGAVRGRGVAILAFAIDAEAPPAHSPVQSEGEPLSEVWLGPITEADVRAHFEEYDDFYKFSNRDPRITAHGGEFDTVVRRLRDLLITRGI